MKQSTGRLLQRRQAGILRFADCKRRQIAPLPAYLGQDRRQRRIDRQQCDIVDVVGKTAGATSPRFSGRIGRSNAAALRSGDRKAPPRFRPRLHRRRRPRHEYKRRACQRAGAWNPGSTAFKTYTGESRATGKTHTLISKAAVLSDVRRSRRLAIRRHHRGRLWKRIGEDTSAKPYKALAIDLLARHAVTAIRLSTSHSAPIRGSRRSKRQDQCGPSSPCDR